MAHALVAMACCRALRLKWLVVASLILTLAWSEQTSPERIKLPKHLSHFEGLSYNRYAVHDHHRRQQNTRISRRASSHEHSDSVHPLRIHIRAFGRALCLVLEPNLANQIAARVTLVNKNGVKESLEDGEGGGALYHGYVEGIHPSFVHGFIHDGVFTGVVHAGGETYHLEPSWRYFGGTDMNFHSIVYRTSDVRYHVPDGQGERNWAHSKGGHSHSSGHPSKSGDFPGYQPASREQRSTHSLTRRALSSNRSFCLLRVTVDQRFFATVGCNSTTIIRNEIATLFREVNEIFAQTDFDFDSHPDGIQFHIPEVEVLTNAGQPNSGLDQLSLSLEEMLELWADVNHEDFCLAILLTFRNFNTSLGLAFQAGVDNNQVGGLCQRRLRVSGKLQSLNSAVASFGLFNVQIPDAVAIATIAHQLGHGFGAAHDPDTGSCSPGVQGGGNFVMFPRATEGTLPNNLKFSNCSIKSMVEVVRTKATCLLSEKATCGNGIIEEGEECDCQSPDPAVCASNDPCCTPTCKLAPSAQCSPKTGAPCCSDKCRFMSADHVCQPEGDCNLEVTCDGTSDVCPVTTDSHKPNATFCSSNTRTCVKGRCTGSICVHLGENATECQCVDSDEHLCDICCKVDGECKSTFSLSRSHENISGTLRAPGQVCGDYRGFCDLSSPPRCLTFGNRVITVTDEVATSSPNAHNTSSGAFIGAISFLCLALCVAVVVGMTVGALLFAKKKKLTAAPGAVSYHMFKEEDPPLRGPLPPIPTPESAETAYVVPIKSNPAYQVGRSDVWLSQLQAGMEHTYEQMP